MPNIKKQIESDEENTDNITSEEFVRNLTLDDYIKNEKTHKILLDEHQYQYDTYIRPKICKLYYDLNCQFQDHKLFLNKDPSNIGGDSFADFIFNFINTK